ncbi:hypothetical protein, variant [Capsaspora owczarzaki ATCC 30864]|uniref:Uncharacterized protein n=1 Tax=Capsaspora owczarzaki (strain ATCC 30864) TaxID=595528 RepID=A0A0D2U0K7_CAPO3|nr:hypothetical protein, variant [Capsaspora owczarzaki ATCC 30864]
MMRSVVAGWTRCWRQKISQNNCFTSRSRPVAHMAAKVVRGLLYVIEESQASQVVAQSFAQMQVLLLTHRAQSSNMIQGVAVWLDMFREIIQAGDATSSSDSCCPDCRGALSSLHGPSQENLVQRICAALMEESSSIVPLLVLPQTHVQATSQVVIATALQAFVQLLRNTLDTVVDHDTAVALAVVASQQLVHLNPWLVSVQMRSLFRADCMFGPRQSLVGLVRRFTELASNPQVPLAARVRLVACTALALVSDSKDAPVQTTPTGRAAIIWWKQLALLARLTSSIGTLAEQLAAQLFDRTCAELASELAAGSQAIKVVLHAQHLLAPTLHSLHNVLPDTMDYERMQRNTLVGILQLLSLQDNTVIFRLLSPLLRCELATARLLAQSALPEALRSTVDTVRQTWLLDDLLSPSMLTVLALRQFSDSPGALLEECMENVACLEFFALAFRILVQDFPHHQCTLDEVNAVVTRLHRRVSESIDPDEGALVTHVAALSLIGAYGHDSSDEDDGDGSESEAASPTMCGADDNADNLAEPFDLEVFLPLLSKLFKMLSNLQVAGQVPGELDTLAKRLEVFLREMAAQTME